MTQQSVSETVEFRGGPADGTILVTCTGYLFEVRHRADGKSVHCYEETGRLTSGGHREVAYRGVVYE